MNKIFQKFYSQGKMFHNNHSQWSILIQNMFLNIHDIEIEIFSTFL